MNRPLWICTEKIATSDRIVRPNAAGRASAEEIHRVFSVVFESNFAAVVTTEQWIAAVQSQQALPRDSVMASNARAKAD